MCKFFTYVYYIMNSLSGSMKLVAFQQHTNFKIHYAYSFDLVIEKQFSI